jgi:imidazolonepropionase-like amidohydrolase
VLTVALAAGLPVTAHAHGLPAVGMAMAADVDGIEHCSFLTDKGVSQSAEDLARLAAAGTAGAARHEPPDGPPRQGYAPPARGMSARSGCAGSDTVCAPNAR